jgi:hypothetical protein
MSYFKGSFLLKAALKVLVYTFITTHLKIMYYVFLQANTRWRYI